MLENKKQLPALEVNTFFEFWRRKKGTGYYKENKNGLRQLEL